MARYAMNLKNGVVIAATEETFRHPDYVEILPIDAKNISDGKIKVEAAMAQLILRRSRGGSRRTIEDLNKFHTANVRTGSAVDSDGKVDDGPIKPLDSGSGASEPAPSPDPDPASIGDEGKPAGNEGNPPVGDEGNPPVGEPEVFTDKELMRMSPKRLREIAAARGVVIADEAGIGKADILEALGVKVAE